MTVTETKTCPFCNGETDTEFAFCTECGHSFEEKIIEEPLSTTKKKEIIKQEVFRKYDQRQHAREYVITFAVGIPVMFGMFIVLLIIGMLLWIEFYIGVHIGMGIIFFAISALIGIIVNLISKNEKTIIIKATILALEYAIAVSVVITFYISLEAVYLWEYLAPISGVVFSTLNVIFFAWLAKLYKQKNVIQHK